MRISCRKLQYKIFGTEINYVLHSIIQSESQLGPVLNKLKLSKELAAVILSTYKKIKL
jgi:hypothetical protein